MALFTAITVVIPKLRLHGKGEMREKFDAHENPLFFGHFAAVRRDRFVEAIADIAMHDAVLRRDCAGHRHDRVR